MASSAPYDLSSILLEEARLLRDRAIGSARMVLIVILAMAGLMVAIGMWRDAIVWIALAGAMAGLTVIYARWFWSGGIAPDQFRTYLRGHVALSATTGLVWGGFAMHVADGGAELRTFVAGLFLSSITTGGAMSGTIYRPGYLALAACSILPFAFFLLLFGSGMQQVFGIFMLLYFAFCYVTNEHAAGQTRDAIIGRLRDEAAQKILEQGAEIQRLNTDRARFLASLSHDMAQPLLAQRHLIMSMAANAQNADEVTLLSQIRETQDSQERMLQALADFAQAEKDIVPARPEPVDLAGLLGQIAAEYREPAAEKAQTIRVTASANTIHTDRHFLERILRNLLSNAVKYGAAGPITIGVLAQDDGVEIRVHNLGEVVSTAELAAVFNEFERLPRHQDRPGLGLGLTVSRRLAKKLGGTLQMQSDAGGTTLLLRLPREQVAEGEDPAPFIVLIGPENLPGLGALGSLFSAWLWRYAQLDTADQMPGLMRAMQAHPDLVLLNCAGQAVDPDHLAQLAIHAPLICLDAPGSGDDVLGLPIAADDLRHAILAKLQNKASSRPR